MVIPLKPQISKKKKNSKKIVKNCHFLLRIASNVEYSSSKYDKEDIDVCVDVSKCWEKNVFFSPQTVGP